ncbi:MAG: aldo/keto reductase [Firmicutes bacterium]|nr:aldo/keto reductase [Dethiobacter sp.]MBS3889573.1 aldo/keto reductase [Bacillota bacterium]MBS4054488.1 aldo/keto reductase [Thermaerobacter sp.]
MEYRTLGLTGLTVSRLGLGGIPIQRATQEVAAEMIAVCHDLGINFIDTARGYRDSEEKLGKALQSRRSSFYLASKSARRDAEGFRQDLELSLKLLQTDYIDIYQLHMVSAFDVWEQVQAKDGALSALLAAREQGLVRFIGVTSHNNDVLEVIIKSNLFDTAQFPLNVVESQFVGSLTLSRELKMGTIAMKPLAGGALQRADLALRYLLPSDIDTLIPGMDTVEQLHANYRALELGALSPQELTELEADAKSLGEDFCRRCEYCLPCPQGIRIPTLFILEGYTSRYGLQEWARERYAGMPVHADDCTECGLCEQRCPYGLSIRRKLKTTAEVFRQT